MWLDGLGFALLVWMPAVLHGTYIRSARKAADIIAENCMLYCAVAAVQEPCSAPNLKDGYFIPVQESYTHDESITYSCDAGYKPRTEGWWATITCDNGEWSDDPQCVGENLLIIIVVIY